jgi:hypothetical protein
MPPHDAVDRDESTKVVVAVAMGTDAGGGAAATDGIPVSANPTAERRRAKAVSAPAPER